MTSPRATSARLRRELGLPGAVLMGLGAMIGTGIFVSIGVAAGVAGPAVIAAVVVAGGVAFCNALSSAQLAADHPVSGGTYEYGYRYLSPALGFAAGWMFLLAKSASAATAALGLAGYALHAAGASPHFRVPVALGGVIVITTLTAGGIRRSSAVNAAIVTITLLSLLVFVAVGLPHLSGAALNPFHASGAPTARGALAGFFQGIALMFVAYTGYGRIATLGEEVREPARTIPRAIVTTMIITAVIYLAVAVVAVGTGSAAALYAATASETAPLALAADGFAPPWVASVLTLGAITAMAGVLLNLLLGISRVLLAMGRRHDAPGVFARLNAAQTTPTAAVLAVGVLIAALVMIGDVRTTWSFSAFTVLVYYAITNLAALRLRAGARRYPRGVAAAGLTACLLLAFAVDAPAWRLGLALLGVGMLWHLAMRRIHANSHPL